MRFEQDRLDFFDHFERSEKLKLEFIGLHNTIVNQYYARDAERVAEDQRELQVVGVALNSKKPIVRFDQEAFWPHENDDFIDGIRPEFREAVVEASKINKELYAISNSADEQFVGRRVSIKALNQEAIWVYDRPHASVSGGGVYIPPKKYIKRTRGEIGFLSLYNGDRGMSTDRPSNLCVDKFRPGARVRHVDVVRASSSGVERLVDIRFLN